MAESKKYADSDSLRHLWIRIRNAFSSQGHTHKKSEITDLPTVAQSGEYKDLINKPIIPTIPASLPANGGNADTVDGIHVKISSTAPTSNDQTVMTVVI